MKDNAGYPIIKEHATAYAGINLCWDTETNECWVSFGNNCQNYIGQMSADIIDKANDYIKNELLPTLK